MITLALVEDMPLMQMAVEEILSHDPALTLARVYAHSKQLLQENLPEEVEVLVMDLGMPSAVDPIQVITRIKTQRPEVKVIVYTSKDDPLYVQDCLTAGACGYLLKDEVGEALGEKIKEAYAGHRVFSPRIEALLRPSSFYRTLLFSPEDLSLLRLMAQGATLAELEEALQRSPLVMRRMIFVLSARLGVLTSGGLHFNYETVRQDTTHQAHAWQLIPEQI